MPEQGASWAVFMEDPLSLEQCAGRLERRGFRSFVVPGLREAAEVMRGLVREEKWEIRRQGMTADLFLTGVNAVSMEGTLHWVDMVGNRVAPVAFGPRHVILLAGSNKLVATPAEARERIRRIAPLNARRHEGFRTPCMHTGICADCNSPDRLCNIHMSIVKCFPKGRISVILMEEPGGL